MSLGRSEGREEFWGLGEEEKQLGSGVGESHSGLRLSGE